MFNDKLKTIFYSLLLSILIVSNISAEDKDIYRLIFGEIIYNSEAYSNLRELYDDIGGRVSGTEAGYRAERWALQKFTSYGLHFWRFKNSLLMVCITLTLNALKCPDGSAVPSR